MRRAFHCTSPVEADIRKTDRSDGFRDGPCDDVSQPLFRQSPTLLGTFVTTCAFAQARGIHANVDDAWFEHATDANVAAVAAMVVPGAEIRIATDH